MSHCARVPSGTRYSRETRVPGKPGLPSLYQLLKFGKFVDSCRRTHARTTSGRFQSDVGSDSKLNGRHADVNIPPQWGDTEAHTEIGSPAKPPPVK